MKKYEAYKNSGIEWIGQIPKEWEVIKIKNLCNVTDGTHFSPRTESIGKPYVTVSNVNNDFVDVGNALLISEEDFDTLVRQGCQPKVGDVLLSKDGTVGRSAIVGNNNGFVCLSSLGILSPKAGLFSGYLKRSLDSIMLQDQMNRAMAGSALKRITISKINEFHMLLPPLSEQQAIASYLDHKVGQIDASISAINTQIDDLKAYRQSIISETVTKGLDPNVPMKDSGIEWIGEIPEEWDITKLGWAYPNMGSGTTPDSNNLQYYVEDGYNWLQTGDLTDGAITSTSKHLSQIAVDEKRMRFYPIGSIVIAMYGATIGKVGYLEIETSTNQACCVLPPQESMDNRFMFYMMQSSKTTLISKSVGGGQPNISQAIIQEHRIPVPSVDEQHAIASYLDIKTSKIDATIASLESQRDDLNALKQSVISEAVTGKIDVRDWTDNNV